MLCSWARHLTLTVPLSTQVYKWVPANCWGNLTNCGEVTCDGLASRPGGVEILLAASCYGNRDKLRQHEPVLAFKASLLNPSPSCVINNNVFDITMKKSKHYYSLLINKKAQFPRAFNKLQGEFQLPIDSSQKVFMLPHKVALEPYVKAFQYKILNSLLYTNTKLYKIGFRTFNKCTFCQSDLETLHHLLYSCPHSKTFWNEFEQYGFSITRERICLTKKDIIVGIIKQDHAPCLIIFLLLQNFTYGIAEGIKPYQMLGRLDQKFN